MKKCLNCEKETTNPKFCSRSCSSIYNNKKYPKRATKKKCLICEKPVKSYKHNRCEKHWEEYRTWQKESYRDKTLHEYHNKMSIKGKHPSWINSHIRGFARSWNKHLTNLPCSHCGYDKHVEICHIKPISSFSPNTTLGEINSLENVIQLCPNCHWEFDNLSPVTEPSL